MQLLKDDLEALRIGKQRLANIRFADIRGRTRDVRFTLNSGHAASPRKESALCRQRTSRSPSRQLDLVAETVPARLYLIRRWLVVGDEFK